LKDIAPAVVCGIRTQVNLTPDDMIELICTGKVVLEKKLLSSYQIPDDDAISDSTFLDELEIRRREEKEMRDLSDAVETGVSSLFRPKIEQRRSTVIVDQLSEDMKRAHLGVASSRQSKTTTNEKSPVVGSWPTSPLQEGNLTSLTLSPSPSPNLVRSPRHKKTLTLQDGSSEDVTIYRFSDITDFFEKRFNRTVSSTQSKAFSTFLVRDEFECPSRNQRGRDTS
jgi:hypothetical protein